MRKNSPKIFLICGLLLTLGIFLSIVLYFSLSNANQLKKEKLLTDSFNNIHNRISNEVDKNLNALHALKAFYEANKGFTREEFKSFGSFYTDNIQSIQALEWVPLITLAERDSFELATRNEGIKNFQITTRVGDSLVRAESRPSYFPVYFIQPLKGNEAAMGYDPGESSQVRSEAIKRAIHTGDAATSNIMRIIQKSSPHKAILVFVPVYVNKDLIGLIEGVYLMEQLINSAVDGLDLRKGLEITITGKNGLEELLFSNADNSEVVPDITKSGDIKIADQVWELKVAQSQEAHFNFFDPLWLLLGGLIFTILLVKVVYDTLSDNRVQLIKNLKELKQKNQDLEQYAYVASHDLQEPLHSLQSLVNLIKAEYQDKFDERGTQYLDYLYGTTERMSLLIKNLLNYSRIGRMEEIELVDCNQIVQTVLKDLGQQIENTKAEIRIENEMPKLRAYPTSLHQLFQNLISNAIKFQPKDQIPVIKISSKQINNFWEFKIEDNGIGIPESALEKVFVIFKRLHSSSKYPGTGVGLANCKKIVELHNGTIWVESKVGEGSTFYFTLNLN